MSTRLVMLLGCSAAFSADPDGTPRLPFDQHAGRLIADRWERWPAWDPVRMLDRHAEALRDLRAVRIDAGTRDEWFLDLSAEAFYDGLRRIGLPAGRIEYELFPAGHGGIDHRYPPAVRRLAHRLVRRLARGLAHRLPPAE